MSKPPIIKKITQYETIRGTYPENYDLPTSYYTAKSGVVCRLSNFHYTFRRYAYHVIGKKRHLTVNPTSTQPSHKEPVYPVIRVQKRGTRRLLYFFLIVDGDFNRCLKKGQTLEVGDVIKKGNGYFRINSFSVTEYAQFFLGLTSLVSGAEIKIQIKKLKKLNIVDESKVSSKIEKMKQQMESALSNLKTEIEREKEANLMRPRRVLGIQNRFVSRMEEKK